MWDRLEICFIKPAFLSNAFFQLLNPVVENIIYFLGKNDGKNNNNKYHLKENIPTRFYLCINLIEVNVFDDLKDNLAAMIEQEDHDIID